MDESDPEWWGSDEPYVVFGVITEEMAESRHVGAGLATPVYEDVDDGDTRPGSGDENLRLFGFTGPRAIDASVLISGHLLRARSRRRVGHDRCGPCRAHRGRDEGGRRRRLAGWIVAGVAVLGIGVSYLVDLIGADDKIDGSLAMSLTQADADARTAAVNPTSSRPLHFDGGDGDGIYDGT